MASSFTAGPGASRTADWPCVLEPADHVPLQALSGALARVAAGAGAIAVRKAGCEGCNESALGCCSTHAEAAASMA